MTHQIRDAAGCLGITLHDHLIIGKDRELSFQGAGLSVTSCRPSHSSTRRFNCRPGRCFIAGHRQRFAKSINPWRMRPSGKSGAISRSAAATPSAARAATGQDSPPPRPTRRKTLPNQLSPLKRARLRSAGPDPSDFRATCASSVDDPSSNRKVSDSRSAPSIRSTSRFRSASVISSPAP